MRTSPAPAITIDEDELVAILEECDRLFALHDVNGVKRLASNLRDKMSNHNIKETPSINLVLRTCRETKAEINRKLHGG